MGELKTKICKKHSLEENKILLKRGGRLGVEIKKLR